MITKLTITLLVVVVTGLVLRAVWLPKVDISSGPINIPLCPETQPVSFRDGFVGYSKGHNIAIGPGAGRDITTESYQFCFATDPNCEYRANMSHKEYEVISAVVKRAHAAGNLYEPVIGAGPCKNIENGSDNVCIDIEPGKAFTSLRKYREYVDNKRH